MDVDIDKTISHTPNIFKRSEIMWTWIWAEPISIPRIYLKGANEMIKKTAFYAGITLLVQSVSMLVLFFLLFAKKKNLATVLLAMSAAGGITGGYLLYKHAKRVKAEEDLLTEFLGDDEYIGDDDIEILTDEVVDEAEFCYTTRKLQYTGNFTPVYCVML